ncbi:MAG: hypothetical protein EZS28_026182 [Streblomastix strix]|uniref:Transmembrane protein n=1 Tax=Streblomastix strix TaxID=222440 RepID=A0A5J4V7R0_9EUKA|nr:MAG: hypothetical protein EZS28_026182 [Streblomastix strix]
MASATYFKRSDRSSRTAVGNSMCYKCCDASDTRYITYRTCLFAIIAALKSIFCFYVQIMPFNIYFQKPRLRQKKTRKKLNRLNQNQKTLTMRVKRSIAPDRTETLQPREISVEISLWNREEERVDEDGFSRD